MTWTYTNPATYPRDEVRFLVGDTTTGSGLVTDEEIAYALAKCGANVYGAAIMIAEGLAMKFAVMADATIGTIQVSYVNRSRNYANLARSMRHRYASQMDLEVYAGGISDADVTAQEADTDRIDTAFQVGMHDILNDQVSDSTEDE